jgi:hypothetical protein
MNVNINKARGDAIIAELARYGYEAYVSGDPATSAQVLVRPILHADYDNCKTQTLPIELSSQLNNARGSVLIALRIKMAAQMAETAAAKKAETEAAAQAVEAAIVKAPGFGDGPSGLKHDPILRAGEDFGAE